MSDKYQIPFVNSCIRALAGRCGLQARNAYLYLKHFKGLDFLMEFYDTLHLQSIDDTVDELLIVCKKHGGSIA